VYIGHGFGDPNNKPYAPAYVEVGGTAYGYAGKGTPLGPTYSPTGPRPGVDASVLCNFSCNSNVNKDFFVPSGKRDQIQVTIRSGKDGYTTVGTLEKAANAFIKAYLGAKGNTKANYRGQSSFAVTCGDSATCGDFCFELAAPFSSEADNARAVICRGQACCRERPWTEACTESQRTFTSC